MSVKKKKFSVMDFMPSMLKPWGSAKEGFS